MQDLPAYVMGKSKLWDWEVESVFAKDGTPAYPDFMPLAAINAKRTEIDELFFACQYLNNPLPEGHRVFAEEKLKFLRMDQLDLKTGSNYCFFDPSSGKDGNDYPAVIWVNVLNGRRVIFDAIDVQHGLTPLIGLIAAKNLDYRVKALVFETNGALTMEKTLADAHKTPKHQQAGYFIKLVAIHEGRHKVERIRSIQPDLYNGSWFFRKDWEKEHPEMRNQILFFPAWGNDDFPDVVEKAVSWLTLNMPDPAKFKALGAA
jgi:phage terminase large subunit-like protein